MADTAARLAISARRNEVARVTFVVTGIDLTGVDMALVVRLDRGVPGAPLISLPTVNSLATEGLKFDGVAIVGGVPVSTIRARINQSTMSDAAKVPYTGEVGSDAVFQYAMVWTIGGDTRTRLLGEFIVQDSAYGSDNAPTNRPIGYSTALRAGGASSGALQFGDQVVYVTIDGADELGILAADISASIVEAKTDIAQQVELAEDARDAAIAASSISKIVAAPAMPTSTSDSAGRVAEYVSPAGRKHTAYAQVRVLNGVRPEALILGQKYKRARSLSAAAYCGVVGQSLAQTTFSGANITTTQRGRALVAPWEVANPSSTSFMPATTIAQPANGETPMFALVNEPYALLERENGLTDDRHGLTLVSGNNALGGTAISANNRGSVAPNAPANARYVRCLNQITALRQRGIDTGTPTVSFGRFGMIGEVEQATNAGFDSVKLAVQTWGRDIAADDRAILTGADEVSRGQTFDPILFVDTTCAYAPGSNVRATPRAILAAAIDYHLGIAPAGFAAPAPVVHTTATYPLGCPKDNTGVHVNSDGSHAAGAYGALAIKRIFLDEIDPAIPQNKRFPPMYIIGARRIGNTVVLKFQMRAPHAALCWGVSAYPDGSGIGEQQDYGFAVWDGSALRSIARPKIVAPDELAITVSSGSLTDGLRISAGLDRPATKMLLHTGAACNLRDDYGDLVRSSIGFPLHNWLSPQGATLDATTAGFTRF